MAVHTKSSVPIVFIHDYRALPFPRKRLVSLAQRIYKQEKIAPFKETLVVFCSDYVIKKLNTRFRNKPCATDVLSFNYDDSDLVGEIYISLQRAMIQSRRFNSTYDAEIERLFIHGMMHLLGFDHETGSERISMETREKRYRTTP